jgi:protein TonB
VGLTFDYTWLPPPKLFADRADINFMNIYRVTPMRFVWWFVVAAAVLGAMAWAQDAPKKITKAEALSNLAAKVQPEYPAVARQLKIQGTVELMVLVAENGSVKKVDIVSGNPVLTAVAAMTVKTWKFKPFTEDGKPIEVMAPVSLDFKL